MRDEAVDWAGQLLGPVRVEELKHRPWASTWRLEQPGRPDRFLKASTAHTGHEAVLLPVLAKACPDLVPEVVAADPAGHRLIVASAGTVLRELHPSFDLAVWIPLVQRFAQLQRAVMPQVEELLAQGVPDERPERHLEMLRSFTAVPHLRERVSALASRWRPLETVVPPSVQHGDLHDNNVAVAADGTLRFFDFGDASVAHPFSTMDLPVMFAREDGADVSRLEDAYLEAFTDLAPLTELRAELHAVLAVAPLQRARNWLRALTPDEHPLDEMRWDQAAAEEWDRPIEYWLARLAT